MTCFIISQVLLSVVFGDTAYFSASYWSVENWIQGQNKANYYGRNLASVHSLSQSNEMNKLCVSSTNQDCWIGLYFDTMSLDPMWIDKTKPKKPVIDNNWCEFYPIIENNSTYNNKYHSVVYIDHNESCWKNTIYEMSDKDESANKQIIMGPQTAPQSIFYWPTTAIQPALFGFIIFVYSLWITIFLYRNLFLKMHNWMIAPTAAMRYSAMALSMILCIFGFSISVYGILYYVQCQETGFIIYNSNHLDKNFPKQAQTFNTFMLIVTGFVIISATAISPLYHFHIFLKLKNECNNNKFFKSAMPGNANYVFQSMVALIVCSACMPYFYLVCILVRSEDEWKMLFAGLWLLSIVFSNALLLICYLRGLYNFSEYYVNVNQANIQKFNSFNDREHELMVEAARYFVIFGIPIIYNFMCLFLVAFYYAFRDSIPSLNTDIYDWHNMVFGIVLFFQMMLLAEAIYLSFKFSHPQYRRHCYYINACVMYCCSRLARRRNDKHFSLQQKLIQSNDSMRSIQNKPYHEFLVNENL